MIGYKIKDSFFLDRWYINGILLKKNDYEVFDNVQECLEAHLDDIVVAEIDTQGNIVKFIKNGSEKDIGIKVEINQIIIDDSPVIIESNKVIEVKSEKVIEIKPEVITKVVRKEIPELDIKPEVTETKLNKLEIDNADKSDLKDLVEDYSNNKNKVISDSVDTLK